MITRRFAALLCSLLLPLLPPITVSDEEREDGGFGLARELLPDDSEVLQKADDLVSAALEAAEKAVGDSDGKDTLRSMKALLASKRLPIKKDVELHGAWRVRSLQANKSGAFSYPYFDCRIFPEVKALVFHKDKGSQRRLGFLERDSEERFLFAGAMYFAYDPKPKTYLGTSDEVDKEDLERNSVAWLSKIADDRLIMVFPSSKGCLEIYELKR